MSRPDIGLLKNYTTVTASLPGLDPTDPRFVKDGTGRVIGVNPTYTGSGYNPRLKPTTADMFDLSVENYFSDVGQFSAGIFYKKFHNYIQYGSTLVDLTNNGVTSTVEVRGPFNGKGGKLWGIEGTFQRFFDFLPGALSGLGVQLNGTYVNNHGITNSGLKNAERKRRRRTTAAGHARNRAAGQLARGPVQICLQRRRHVREIRAGGARCL